MTRVAETVGIPVKRPCSAIGKRAEREADDRAHDIYR